MNVILVALDTLAAGHMGCYGYSRDTCPTLDRFAAHAVRFERFYAPAIPTQPAYTCLYTGQHSITHGIVTHGGDRQLDDKCPWLPTILRDAGYTTCAVDNLATSMKSWFHRGFEFYIDPSFRAGWPQAVECQHINFRAVEWLRKHRDEKFFLFVHYWDPHTPYLPPAKYRDLFYDGDPTDPAKKGLLHRFYQTDWHASRFRESFINKLAPPGREITDIEYVTAMYDSETRYLDDGLAELLATLDETHLADNTAVIFFADHGEEMYQHDTFFDHHGLYEPNIHVPLLIRWPGLSAAGHVVPNLAQHVDLAPTILEALQLDVPKEMEGRSLLPMLGGKSQKADDEILITQECTYQKKWGVRTEQYKLIVSRENGPDIHKKPPRELYDLKADPGETRNLADERPQVVAQLEQRLDNWIAEMIAKHHLAADPLLEQEITIGKNLRQWLETHNYW